jgi:hypothetical protein
MSVVGLDEWGEQKNLPKTIKKTKKIAQTKIDF